MRLQPARFLLCQGVLCLSGESSGGFADQSNESVSASPGTPRSMSKSPESIVAQERGQRQVLHRTLGRMLPWLLRQ